LTNSALKPHQLTPKASQVLDYFCGHTNILFSVGVFSVQWKGKYNLTLKISMYQLFNSCIYLATTVI